MTSSRRIAIGAAALTVAVMTGLSGTALADPNPSTPGTPLAGYTDSQIVAGVGADADAELMNSVVAAYNAQQPAPPFAMESYDAVNPLTGAAKENIVTKPGCTVSRPNGANTGVALINGTQVADASAGGDGTSQCVDFARSSRAKSSTGTENGLTFWELAPDAVTWVTVGTSYAPRTPLTKNQLNEIFTCTVNDWSEVGGQPGAIHVYAPPLSAGTYTFFLSAIGITDQSAPATGCGSSLIATQQNDGTRLLADPQGIAPYAVSKWAAQSNGAPGISDLRGGTTLGHFSDTVEPVTTTDFNGQTYNVLNPAFATGSNHPGRLLYNVTRDNTTFASIFGPTGFICSHQDELLIPFGAEPLGSDTQASRYCGKPD